MSARDVLTENLPDYFKPVAEFQQTIKAQGYELDRLENIMMRVQDNNYIQTADGNTLTYYERLLKLSANPGDTLEYRRMRILSMIARDSPFSVGFLNQQLIKLYGDDGYMLEIDSQACELKITIVTDIYGAIELFYDFIWDIIPAHILMDVNHSVTNQTDASLHYGGVVEVIETIGINPYRMMSDDVNGKIYYGGAFGVVERIDMT